MSQPPRPEEIRRLLRTAFKSLERLDEHYPLLYGAAYGQAGAGLEGGGSRTGLSDPTGGLASSRDKGAARSRLANAAEAMRSAAAELREAEAYLDKAEPKHPVSEDRPEPPRIIRKAELRESKAAQRRRRIRAEHYD